MITFEKAEFYMDRLLNIKRDMHLTVKDGRVKMTESPLEGKVIDTLPSWPSLKSNGVREVPRFNRLSRLGSLFVRVLGSFLL